MAKILRMFSAIVGAALIVIFAVANRDSVQVSFFPVPLQFEWPLYGVFLGGMFVGALLGGLSLWLSGHEMRKEWRELKKRFRVMEDERRRKEQQDEYDAAQRSKAREDALSLAVERR